MGIGGGAIGSLLVQDTIEEKTRRIEREAIRMENNPNMDAYKKHLQDQHELYIRFSSVQEFKTILPSSKATEYILQSAVFPQINFNEAFLPLDKEISLMPTSSS